MLFITLMMIPRHSGVDSCASQPSCCLPLEKTKVCEKCGDKGDLKRLIYCERCRISAEHSYCIEKLHKKEDGTISWKCEECSLKNAKCGLVQLRKSGRISQAIEAKYNRIKIQKEITTPKKRKLVVLDQADVGKSLDADITNSLENYDTCNGNQDLPTKRRRFEFEDEAISYEEFESLECPSNTPLDQAASEPENEVHDKSTNCTSDDSESFLSQSLLYPECSRHSQAEPASNPVWRGQFRMNNMTLPGLVAHSSTIACSKVLNTVTGLPQLLDVELLSRSVIWPRSFWNSPPTEDTVGLYIFPQYESDEKLFDSVMHDLIEQNLALKATVTNNVELLVFSSRLLPPENWRIARKYYLWGIFREKAMSVDNQSGATRPLS